MDDQSALEWTTKCTQEWTTKCTQEQMTKIDQDCTVTVQ